MTFKLPVSEKMINKPSKKEPNEAGKRGRVWRKPIARLGGRGELDRIGRTPGTARSYRRRISGLSHGRLLRRPGSGVGRERNPRFD